MEGVEDVKAWVVSRVRRDGQTFALPMVEGADALMMIVPRLQEADLAYAYAMVAVKDARKKGALKVLRVFQGCAFLMEAAGVVSTLIVERVRKEAPSFVKDMGVEGDASLMDAPKVQRVVPLSAKLTVVARDAHLEVVCAQRVSTEVLHFV